MEYTNKLYLKRNMLYKEWGENPTSDKYVEYLKYDNEFKTRINRYWPQIYTAYEDTHEGY